MSSWRKLGPAVAASAVSWIGGGGGGIARAISQMVASVMAQSSR